MDPVEDTGYSVTRTARAFMRVAERRLRPLRLGVAQVPVLVALDREESLTQAEIAERTQVEQPTAAALLQRMDRAGLIQRSPDLNDRRAIRICLSDHARQVLPQALELLGQADAEARAGLTADEAATLQDLLDRVWGNLVAMVDDPP